MLSSALLVVLSFLQSVVFVPLLRDLARRRTWVDLPDNGRKAHLAPTPRLGGLAIIVAFYGSVALVKAFLPASALSESSFALFLKLAPASATIFTVGILDDFFNLTARQKLLGQACAAIIAYLSGIQVATFGNHALPSFVGVPVTVIWLMACANGFNLIDGLDGLAGGLALIASGAIVLAALLYHDPALFTAALPLLGALLAFLIFNSHPASIFLGDCGSLWLGFVLGCYSVIWSQHSAKVFGALAPVTALSIPLLETALSAVRRFLRRYPIFKGDRGHIHHRLLDRGLSTRKTVWVLYLASALYVGLSLVQSAERNGAGAIGLILSVCVACLGIRVLNYKELTTAVQLLWNYRLRSLTQIHVVLSEHEKSMCAARTLEDCWQALREVSREFGFTQVELRLGAQSYHEEFERDVEPQWMVQIPLSDFDYVQLRCKLDDLQARLAVAPLMDLLSRTLSLRARDLAVRSENSRSLLATARAGTP